jgi:hypothetical protein
MLEKYVLTPRGGISTEATWVRKFRIKEEKMEKNMNRKRELGKFKETLNIL